MEIIYMDQDKLLECMEEIKAIAQSQQNQMTKEEVHQYLSGMELHEDQFDAVYQYLAMNGITISGYHPSVSFEETTAPEEDIYETNRIQEDTLEEYTNSSDNQECSGNTADGQETRRRISKAERNLELYRREVSALASHSGAELAALWDCFLSGDTSSKEALVHEQLDQVFRIAKTYEKRGIALDEMIAEGNVGILMALERIGGTPSDFRKGTAPDLEHIHAVIEEEIRLAIENMIDSVTAAKDWESTVLAKTNLLHEAAKYLAEENGREATPWELAEYTRIPLAEIHDLLDLRASSERKTKHEKPQQ